MTWNTFLHLDNTTSNRARKGKKEIKGKIFCVQSMHDNKSCKWWYAYTWRSTWLEIVRALLLSMTQNRAWHEIKREMKSCMTANHARRHIKSYVTRRGFIWHRARSQIKHVSKSCWTNVNSMGYDTKSCRWKTCNLHNWVSATPNRVLSPNFSFLTIVFSKCDMKSHCLQMERWIKRQCGSFMDANKSIGPWHEIMCVQRNHDCKSRRNLMGFWWLYPLHFCTIPNRMVRHSFMDSEMNHGPSVKLWRKIMADSKSAWQKIVHDSKSCIHPLSTIRWEISCKISNRAWPEIVPDMKSCMTTNRVWEELCKRSNLAWLEIVCATWNLHMCDSKSNMTSNRVTWNHAWP